MKRNDPKYESIKAKLRKLQALADKGCYGEAQAARHAIETLCAKYGISMEDVLDFDKKRQYTFEIGRGKDMMNLFIRCLDNVCCTGRNEILQTDAIQHPTRNNRADIRRGLRTFRLA